VATFPFTLRVLVFLLAAGIAEGQGAQTEVKAEPLTAAEIMERVAANQDQGEALRNEYVYKQHIHIVTHKPGSRIVREETADYNVEPQPNGTEKQLKSLTGRYWNKGKYVEFQGEQVEGGTEGKLVDYLQNHEALPGGTDADLVHHLRNSVSNDGSKDGLGHALFPLTSGEQKQYEFKLLGQEVEAGRNVYHIAFTPVDEDTGRPMWSGEAFIDAAEFQPVRVFTRLSRRIPLLVRATWFDLPGFGFDVVYKRLQDGVWFPSTFGTEFQMRVGPLPIFNRDVSISLKNSEFEHVHVATK
jgi:hypothetical protein